MSGPYNRFTLRDLPFAGRLTLAVFLCSVGIGYFSALVQLHAQQAKPGQLLPGEEQVVAVYHGTPGAGILERLITADETLPFSSSGSMRSAFTTRSTDWTENLFETRAFDNFAGITDALPEEKKAELIEQKQPEWDNLSKKDHDQKIAAAKVDLRKEREWEAAVLVDWIHHGLDKESYKNNSYPLPEALKGKPFTKKYLKKEADGTETVALTKLFNSRCARCHQEGRDADFAPMVHYGEIEGYATKNIGEAGLPLRKLAQSTHVHLLGFSVLYGMTGLIFACSSWPGLLRVVISPLALFAQVVDIGFWWLARMPDPYGSEFAKCIRFSGMVVAGSLGLQIMLSLFSLFGWFGRFVLVLLIAGALVGAYFINDLVIVPYLAGQLKLATP